MSCSTCHFDGRNDGLTWTFDFGLRQTPSLAGRVSETAPLSWTFEVTSIEHEVALTTSQMGGHGLPGSERTEVAAFIDSTPAADHPGADGDADAIERGAEIFARPEVGCALCHTGRRHTDGQPWPMFGLDAVTTPALTGIATTAPYLHDGRAETLAEVLDLADGEMGDTTGLSASERADLEAYLRSL